MDDLIFVALQDNLKQNIPVKFYNTFRGMPVNFSGTIQKIIGRRVSFQVSNIQIYNILLNGGTFIKINQLSSVLRAQLADFDLQKEVVDLWGFENMVNPIGFRSEIRVEPKQTLGALVTANKNVSLPVTIYNLSLRGMRFMFHADLFDARLFIIGKRMSVLFYIPAIGATPKGSMIHYDIELRNVMLDQSKKHICIGARAFPDKKLENYLVNYLAHRQKELLVELKALCEARLI
jgi:hypothetical protein